MERDVKSAGRCSESTTTDTGTKSGRVLVVGSAGAAGMTLAAHLIGAAAESGVPIIPEARTPTICEHDMDLTRWRIHEPK